MRRASVFLMIQMGQDAGVRTEIPARMPSEMKEKGPPMLRTHLARRQFLAGGAGLALASRTSLASPALVPSAMAASSEDLSVAARSPFLCSGVAVAADGTQFLGLPRFPGMEDTPSLVRVGPDGRLQPFPGGGWNDWRPGRDGREAFVMVNAIHIFRDNTLWVVDQGERPGKVPAPGVEKLVQLDPTDGRILRVLRFSRRIMPARAQFNDLRQHGDLLFVTDSGLGGVIIHDLATGRTLRRLSGQPVMRNDATHLHRGIGGRVLQDGAGVRPRVESDMLEIDAAGTWFYFSVPAGPLKRLRVASLLDARKSDATLAREVEVVADIPSIGGTCIDTLGNIYLSDAENCQITVLAPDGRKATLVRDARLVSPDALFIDRNRVLYIPCSQIQKLAMFNDGVNGTRKPFLVLKMSLPASVGGIALGSVVAG